MTLRLDSLLPKNPEVKLLIKMDIEGSEAAVLDNLQGRLPEQSFIFLELHRGDESLQWINEWARKNEFQFSAVRRRDDAIDGYLARPAATFQQGA